MSNTGQKLKTFRGPTLDQAYRAMRAEMGEDAVVLRTAEVKQTGLWGWLGAKEIELTAAAPKKPGAERAPSRAEKKYLSNANAGTGEARTDTVAYFQQLVSDAQKRMNRYTSETASAQSAYPAARPGGEQAASVVPFRKPESSPQGQEDVQRELKEMREMLQVLMAESSSGSLPPELAAAYRFLLERGVDRKAAATLVGGLTKDLDPGAMRDERILMERLRVELRKRVTVTGGLDVSAGRCRIVGFIGATGVGKTTNLAKLAALFAVRERARVALITTDTYRFAAPEQLRAYANIIGVPMEVVNNAKELSAAVKKLRENDLVLIDTAGGSQFNQEQIREQRQLLAAAQADDVYLLASANTQVDELRSVVKNLRCINPTALFFTKIDETRHFGGIYSVAVEADLPLSYLSIGQNVPDDIVLAQPGAVANLVMEGRDTNRDKSGGSFA